MLVSRDPLTVGERALVEHDGVVELPGRHVGVGEVVAGAEWSASRIRSRSVSAVEERNGVMNAPGGREVVAGGQGVGMVGTEDPLAIRTAGIPDDTGFATKPQLARRMIGQAIAAGVPFGWFAADEAYGDSGTLRA
jgi:hypothetical protein